MTTTYTNALNTDSEQPVSYSNDGSTQMRNIEGRRLITLTDNVKISQGSLVISGDSAVFEYDLNSGELIKISIQGMPAQYQQQLSTSEKIAQGDSDTIDYYVEGESKLEFIGNAHFKTPDTIMSCATVAYFMESEIVNGVGPCQGTIVNQSNVNQSN